MLGCLCLIVQRIHPLSSVKLRTETMSPCWRIVDRTFLSYCLLPRDAFSVSWFETFAYVSFIAVCRHVVTYWAGLSGGVIVII